MKVLPLSSQEGSRVSSAIVMVSSRGAKPEVGIERSCLGAGQCLSSHIIMASAKQNNPVAREAGATGTITPLKVMNASNDRLVPQRT